MSTQALTIISGVVLLIVLLLVGWTRKRRGNYRGEGDRGGREPRRE